MNDSLVPVGFEQPSVVLVVLLVLVVVVTPAAVVLVVVLVVVVGHVPVCGRQMSVILSLSDLGLAPLTLAVSCRTSFPGFFLLPFFFTGTETWLKAPQSEPKRSGVVNEPRLLPDSETGGCGVHLGSAGSLWLGHSATLNVQTSSQFPWASLGVASQSTVPSVQVTLFLAPAGAPLMSNSM